MGQFLSGIRTRQPQQAPRINWANPITRGLKDASIPTARADLVAVSSPAIVATSNMLGFKGDGSSSYWRSAGTKSVSAAAEHTIFALVQGTAAADSRIYSLADGSSTIIQIGAGNGSAAKLRLWERSPSADVGTVNTTATVFEAARPHAAVLRYRIGVLESFVDGVADVTSAGTTVGAAALVQVGIGALVRASAPASYSAATLFLGLFWDRALSDAEIASISANPWQIYVDAPQRRLLVEVPTGGPDVTVALSGQTITSSRGTISPSNAIPVTGNSATVPPGAIAPSLSLPVTGQSVTVSRGTITPAVSIGMTGQSAQALQGSVSVSGTADVTVALAGQAVTASRGTMAPSSAKALTGQSSTAARGSVSPSAALALTGQASSAQQGLMTPARAIVITGQTATAAAGSAGAGIATALVGQTSTAQRGTVSASGNVVVALSGLAATVAQGSMAAFAASAAKFNQSTIMRATVTNRSSTARVTSIAASSTMRPSFSQSTIMRINPLNATATMSDAAINRTANLL